MIRLDKPRSKGLTVTESAVRMVQRIQAKEGKAESLLRVGVKGGGCSGFSYVLDFTTDRRANDQVFEQDGVTILCDPKSYLYLSNSILDFGDGLLDGGFRFTNPQAKKSCACGESFSA